MPLTKTEDQKMKDETVAAQQVEKAVEPGAEFEHGAASSLPASAPASRPSSPPVPAGAGTALTAGASSGNKFGSLDAKLGYGAFPQVKLDKDMFAVGEEGEIESFDFKALGSQSRWIYKSVNEELFFSYDNQTATDGRPVESILADWKADGDSLKERREYQEVYGYILNGEFADRMVVLSVPPASVPRLAGLQAELRAMRGLELGQIVMKIEKGAKIKTKAGQTFYPWKFSFVCATQDYKAE